MYILYLSKTEFLVVFPIHENESTATFDFVVLLFFYYIEKASNFLFQILLI